MGLVLASTSPRRKDLMERAGFNLIVRAPDVEEELEGDPYELVVKNATAKARSVPAGSDDIVIGSDTLVLCRGEILGKPEDIEDAGRMIGLQFQHPQDVITGICVLDKSRGRIVNGYEVSSVLMKGDEEALREHLESGQWKGKAGAYGIQDRGPISIEVIAGNEDNVVGLPLTLLGRLLSLVGFDYPDRTPSEGQPAKRR